VVLPTIDRKVVGTVYDFFGFLGKVVHRVARTVVWLPVLVTVIAVVRRHATIVP
jgi:hypothetical protein